MNRRKLIIAIVIASAVIASLRLLPLGDWIRGFQEYVEAAGPLGYVLFVIVYAVACLVPSPAPTILTLTAGATFGVGRGAAVVLTGATLGATAAFWLARTVLRRRVEQKAKSSPKFDALDRAIGREGGKIVFLTRLSPIFPFTYLNYLFGLTGVAPAAYVVATFLGIIPGSVAFVYIGHVAATAAAGETGTLRLGLQIVGAVATLAVSLFVARIAKREIAKSAG